MRLKDVHLGFDPDPVFQARVAIPPQYRSREDVARFYEQLGGRLATASGVSEVGVISVAPLSGLLLTVPFSLADPPLAERDRPSANLRAISPRYLSAVGTRLVRGRSLSEDDRPNTPPVALVSAALADRFMAGHAVGQRVLIDDNNQGFRPLEVVGVVENVRQVGLDLPPALDIYVPLRQIHADQLQMFRSNQFWMVKTNSNPAAFRATFLSQLHAVDPDAAVSGAGTMRQYLEAWLGPRRFNLGLFAAFAVTAALLAFSGVHGLVSYAVSQRRAEIGLRMAIGATGGDVQRMIVRQAVALSIAGVTIGLGLTRAARPLIAGLVQEVSMSAPVVGSTVSLLVVVVLIAAWLPARRAARIDPAIALRAQ
jgi:putative ABC transport system permease protein